MGFYDKKENSVFYISILLTTLFIIWGITPASWIQGYDLQSVTSSLNSFILNKFGWFYSLLMTAMIILATYLAFSKYGSIRLGKDGENQSIVIHLGYPCCLGQEWELVSSFMESLNRFHILQIHSQEKQVQRKVPSSLCNIHFSTGVSFHVAIRNGCFNNCIFHIPQTKGSTIGATVTPLFNRSKNSPIGKTVDILAVLATVFGIVPSVGIGANKSPED